MVIEKLIQELVKIQSEHPGSVVAIPADNGGQGAKDLASGAYWTNIDDSDELDEDYYPDMDKSIKEFVKIY